MKFNQNHYGLALEEAIPSSFLLQQGETKGLKLRCALGQGKGGPPPQRPPVVIQAGVKCSVDLFYFSLPVLLQVILSKQQPESDLV